MTPPHDTSRAAAAPAQVSHLLRGGHFARKQIFCRSRLIAWSHRARFAAARRIVAPSAGGRLLDYGCGDGTFLATVSDLFPDAVGADAARDVIDQCAARYRSLGKLRFAHTTDLQDASWDGAFDVVTCMETLEHCVSGVVERVLDDLHRLARAGATVVISVPIETGPALLIKQAARALAGWRRLGDYAWRERYTWRELLRMLLAGEHTAIERPVYLGNADDPSSAFHGHKGFNWRAMRRRVGERFEIHRVLFSPLNWSRGQFSSQAWFVCTRARCLDASRSRT